MTRKTSLQKMKDVLKPGEVYRRSDFVKLSSNVDRDLAQLVENRSLQRLQRGIYLCPKHTIFGQDIPDEKKLLYKFLNDHRFIVYSPCMFNMLGFGTTQLYNKVVVLNYKRQGKIAVGSRVFFFHRRKRVPRTITKEFLLVEMLNCRYELAEDMPWVIGNMQKQLHQFDRKLLKRSAKLFGKRSTQKTVAQLLQGQACIPS